MIKILCQANPQILIRIFNLCIIQERFLVPWKRARLVLLRKKNKPLSNPLSYRLLCLLESTGKLLEKILDSGIRNIMEKPIGLADSQSGIRKGRSTVQAVNKLVSVIKDSREINVKVCVLTLGIKNAFNSASWCNIINAAYDQGVPIYLYRVLVDYFCDRRLLYLTNRNQTDISITSGVPQGSVLGPTL